MLPDTSSDMLEHPNLNQCLWKLLTTSKHPTLSRWPQLLPSWERPHPLASRAEGGRRGDADPSSGQTGEQRRLILVPHKVCVGVEAPPPPHGVARLQGKHSRRCARGGRCLQDSRPGRHNVAVLPIYFPSSKLWQPPSRRLQAVQRAPDCHTEASQPTDSYNVPCASC